MIDVFLSYRRNSGATFCSILQEILKYEGYEVFFDHSSLRQGAFDIQIDRAISECTFLLVILAPDDLDRCLTNPSEDWILHEVDLAIKYGKIVIPVAFRPEFKFPNHTGIETLEYLSRQELCDISGPDAVDLIQTKLFRFMNDSPASRLRQEYINGIIQKKYQDWEINTLAGIYQDCNLLYEFNRTHAVTIFEGSNEAHFPFDSLSDPNNLLEKTEMLPFHNTPYYDDFRKIVGPNVHYPDLYGFTNVGLIFDSHGKVSGFRALPRTYKETVYTSHILHYELWRAYQHLDGTRPATLDDLPIRKKIHEGCSNRDVLISGCNRSSLSDVCIAVIAYDELEDDYDIAVATRSANVACHPGYLSIVPSGGFELFELEQKQDDLNVKKNFHIISALYREYIEEMFGDEEFEKPTGDDDLRRLNRNNHVKAIRQNIGRTYFFEFLGVTFDLTSLRPTFTFILRIDDAEFMYENQIRRNKENIDLRFVSLSEFERVVKEGEMASPATPLLPESAGIYRLLKKNHLFQEALKH